MDVAGGLFCFLESLILPYDIKNRMDVAGGLFCFLESLILPLDIKKQNGCSRRAVLFFGVTHFAI